MWPPVIGTVPVGFGEIGTNPHPLVPEGIEDLFGHISFGISAETGTFLPVIL